MCVEEGRRPLTNAVFLLGAFMILKHDMEPQRVTEEFKWLDAALLERYRDATYAPADFGLELIDCWRGLAKGKAHGWIAYAPAGYMLGSIDIDEYRHYDSPLNGDLHEVVPGKLVALQGPVDLGGRDYRDGAGGTRVFSPEYYAEILLDMGVELVVRLNEARYDAASFEARGIRHLDLEFEDCTCPPDAVAAAFLRAVSGARGAVALDCKAGLGRTGTLVALHLMRTHGFTAREAIGWLRVMRPGSVIGDQQRFLCAAERPPAAAPAAGTSPRRRPAGEGAAGCGGTGAGTAAGAPADIRFIRPGGSEAARQ